MAGKPMTPERIKALVDATGLPLRALAFKLGYRSENSLRQCVSGKQALSLRKAAWLERYATFRQRQAETEEAWTQKNPPPNED